MQVPADCGVTVNVALGPLADAGVIVAIGPPTGEHVSVSLIAPLSPTSVAVNVCANCAPVFMNVRAFGLAVSGAGVGLGVGDGVGVGVGDGVGDGVGVGVGDGVGDGVGEGVGDGLAVGVGEGVGDGVADPDAVGLGDGLGVGDGDALALGVDEGELDVLGLGAGKRITPPLPLDPLQLASANASSPIAENAAELRFQRIPGPCCSESPNKRYRPIRFTSDLIFSQGHRKYTARRALCVRRQRHQPSPTVILQDTLKPKHVGGTLPLRRPPQRSAARYALSCLREEMSSLANTLARCFSTVL